MDAAEGDVVAVGLECQTAEVVDLWKPPEDQADRSALIAAEQARRVRPRQIRSVDMVAPDVHLGFQMMWKHDDETRDAATARRPGWLRRLAQWIW